MNTTRITRRAILELAWPIVLANAAVPLLGLVDTAVIGNTGAARDLGAIALGALVFNFVYWGFGFLRMGTTGFVAQASGASDTAEVRAILGRAIMLAGVLGLGLIVLQRPIAWLALTLLGADSDVETLTRAYYDIRIWGAPAGLATFAILGMLVGLGRTRHLLATQVLLNGLNITLDLLFAGVFGWGVEGIALGTVIAEWTTLSFALALSVGVLLRDRTDSESFWPWQRIFDRAKGLQTLVANADIMVRTLFLLMGFAWFTNQGAGFGNEVLAANHVLLQLVALTAYLLGGYAHATETHVGRAVGAERLASFDQAVRSATELAALSAVALATAMFALGPGALRMLTDLQPVREIAAAYLPLAAVYVLVSFAAFQLDGIFIGATATRAMRDASVLSFAAFIAASLLLVPRYENLGLWIAFVLYVTARAITLGLRYPKLRRSIAG